MSDDAFNSYLKKGLHRDELEILAFDKIIISHHYVSKKKLLGKGTFIPMSNVKSISTDSKKTTVTADDGELAFKTKNVRSTHLLLCAIWHWNNCDNEANMKRTLQATLDISEKKKKKSETKETKPEPTTEPDKKNTGAVARVLGNANVSIRILNKLKGKYQELQMHLTRGETTVKDDEKNQDQKFQNSSFKKLILHNAPWHFTLSGEKSLHFMLVIDSADAPTSKEHITAFVKNIKQKATDAEIVYEPHANLWCDKDAIDKAVSSASKITGVGAVPFGVKPPTVKKKDDTGSSGGSPAVSPQKSPSSPTFDASVTRSTKEAITEDGEFVHLNMSRPKKAQKKDKGGKKKGDKPKTKKPATIVLPDDKGDGLELPPVSPAEPVTVVKQPVVEERKPSVEKQPPPPIPATKPEVKPEPTQPVEVKPVEVKPVEEPKPEAVEPVEAQNGVEQPTVEPVVEEVKQEEQAPVVAEVPVENSLTTKSPPPPIPASKPELKVETVTEVPVENKVVNKSPPPPIPANKPEVKVEPTEPVEPVVEVHAPVELIQDDEQDKKAD